MLAGKIFQDALGHGRLPLENLNRLFEVRGGRKRGAA
jgi:hypothetical protein